MANDATTYSSDQVVVVVGSIKIDEKGTDEFCSLEQAEDDYTITTGVGGHTIFNRTNNRGVKVTLRILSTSASNKLLTEMRKADLASPNGTFVSFTVTDRLGNDLHTGSKCKITRPPNGAYAKEAKDNEWVLYVSDMDLYFGGH